MSRLNQKSLEYPQTLTEQMMVQMAAYGLGIAPVDPGVVCRDLPREVRRKYRKLWRTAAKKLMAEHDENDVHVVYFGTQRHKDSRRRRLVTDFLTKKVKKECTNS
jgi:hypothetical protein